jgi:solute carrier family 25 iron transporter 28/37
LTRATKQLEGLLADATHRRVATRARDETAPDARHRRAPHRPASRRTARAVDDETAATSALERDRRHRDRDDALSRRMTPSDALERAARASSSATTARASVDGACVAHSPAETAFYAHMASGALAGAVEHTAMFPVDTIKTRLQVAASGTSYAQAIGTLTARASAANAANAVRSLYRGVSAAGLGAGPAHAVYFATYEKCKVAFGGGNVNEHAPVAHALAGVCATVLADGLQNPVDTVKQRLQISDSPYKGALDCVAKTFRNEGVRAFYRSYPTTLAMNVPFTAIHFAAYESAKTALFKASEAEKEGFAVQFAAGGVAGGLAAAATTPMDVVKTRMQTQCVLLDCDVAKTVETTYNSVCTARGAPKICPQELAAQRARSAAVRSASPMDVARAIVRDEGALALTRGMSARVLFHIPAAAICWTTYEAAKRAFGLDGDDAFGRH